VVGRRPFGGALVVRIRNSGHTRDYDLADEITSALWVHTDHPHPGCLLGDADMSGV
jgi:DtxR family transcriptional regulator, Mn-dependent transcriptional regulator